jgi:hypothetical protein|tara:strand:- start:107 stop:553 length:447 start_codon:yes stop_codon:yes gene_type:complete
MAYLIFNKDLDNVSGTLCAIAANNTDLNNLNIDLDTIKKITIDDSVFSQVQLSESFPESYDGETVIYAVVSHSYENQEIFQTDINNRISLINRFLKFNGDHPDYTKWNNFKTQLENLDIKGLTYPYEKSLEKHLLDNSLTFLNPLQLP